MLLETAASLFLVGCFFAGKEVATLAKNRNGLVVLNDSLSALARFLKYFGTSALTSLTVRSFLKPDPVLTNWLLVVCGVLAGTAGSVELLHTRLKKSKKIAKLHQAILRSERFLDFIMLFKLLDSTAYYILESERVLESKNISIGIASAIAAPFGAWRAYKTAGMRYLTREPILVALASNLKSTELLPVTSLRPISSDFFSTQSFRDFKKRHGTTTDLECPLQLGNAEILRKYFNEQMSQRTFFNRYMLMDAISYGGEIAGIVGYTMYTLGTLFKFSDPMLNFGISAFFSIAGSLVGYRIEKIKELSLAIYQSNFAEDQGLQDDIHELLVDLYANVTTNVRRFAKVAEFIKTFLAAYIGFMFVYTAIANTGKVKEYYAFGVAPLLSLLVGINAIYNVERKQQEMLKETGAYEVLEEHRLPKQEQAASTMIVEEIVDAETRTVVPSLPITTPKKGYLPPDQLVAAGVGLLPNDSPASSDGSSVSDSPPQSRSLPTQIAAPAAPLPVRAQSIAGEELRTEVQAQRPHHRKQGWGEWIRHTIWGDRSTTISGRELAPAYLPPADHPDAAQLAGAKV